MKAQELKAITKAAKEINESYIHVIQKMLEEAKKGNHFYKTSGLHEEVIKRIGMNGFTIEQEEQTSGEVIQYIIWR